MLSTGLLLISCILLEARIEFINNIEKYSLIPVQSRAERGRGPRDFHFLAPRRFFISRVENPEGWDAQINRMRLSGGLPASHNNGGIINIKSNGLMDVKTSDPSSPIQMGPVRGKEAGSASSPGILGGGQNSNNGSPTGDVDAKYSSPLHPYIRTDGGGYTHPSRGDWSSGSPSAFNE